MRPIIGINANFARETTETPSVSVKTAYIDAVIAAGGIPVILPPVEDTSFAAAMAKKCDGFIFIGGPDLDPQRYNQDPHPTINALPSRRESYDFSLINAVISLKKPFLAICLGQQEVNVALGGTLIQDILSVNSTDVQHYIRHSPHYARHDVIIEEDSKLYDLVGSKTLSTNTSHHQAVETLGKGLRVTAHCTDETIEAYELENYPFGLGIQWHPEQLANEKEHLAIFEGLVKAAVGTRKKAPAAARRRSSSIPARR